MKYILTLFIFSSIAFAQEQESAQQTPSSEVKENSKDKVYLYLGMAYRNTILLKGTLSGSPYTVDFKMSTPHSLVGASYLFSLNGVNDRLFVGPFVEHQFSQDSKSSVQTVGSSIYRSEEKTSFTVTSFGVKGEVMIPLKEKMIGGAGASISIDKLGMSGSAYSLDKCSSATFGVHGALKYESTRVELRANVTRGTASATLKTNGNTKISGDYSSSSLSLVVGYEF